MVEAAEVVRTNDCSAKARVEAEVAVVVLIVAQMRYLLMEGAAVAVLEVAR